MKNIETDFTLIMPTYNRSEWLNSTLKTIANFNLKILVMDGSTSKTHIDNNQKLIEHLNQKNDDHLINHIVDDGSFFKRINMAANMIETEYCKICADDDLFSIEFITDALSKLKSNNKIASVEGSIASYDMSRKKFIGFTHQHHDDLSNPELFIRATATNSRTAIFGVMPTRFLRLCSKLSLEIEGLIVDDVDNDNLMWAAYRLMELIYRTTTIFSGTIERSNNLMLLRLYHDDNLGGKLATNSKHATYFLNANLVLCLGTLCDRITSEFNIPNESVRPVIFYDYFFDLSNRLPTIKSEIRSSANRLESNPAAKGIAFNFLKSIGRVLRFILNSVRHIKTRKKEAASGMNPAKQEAKNLIDEFLINHGQQSHQALN